MYASAQDVVIQLAGEGGEKKIDPERVRVRKLQMP